MHAPAITFRLLSVSVVMPAIFVGLDQAALAFGAAYRWSPVAGVSVCTWFTLQTGLLSYLAGSKLPNWGWRFLLLGWSQVLVNLLLATGAMDDRWDQRLLAMAFLSAEFGALAAWLILGSGWFPIRLGLVALEYLPVKYLAEALEFDLARIQWGDVWTVIVAVQVAATGGLAALLKVAGYAIEHESSAAKAETAALADVATRSTGGPVQFSIRHLLIATTVVAILVPVVQAMLRSSSRWMGGGQFSQAAADGMVLAFVSLAALWAALGSGRWPLKVLVFALLASLAGGGLCWLESVARWWPPYGFAPVPLTYAGWRWIAWTWLTGYFLASMLLVLRATGYRLMRRRKF